MPLDADRIDKAVRRVRKFVKQAPKRPSVDKVHKLRTGARRIESVLEALGLESGRRRTQLVAALERIRKRAGKVRDMDVLTAHALTLRAGAEQDCVVQLVEHLGKRRDQAARKLRQAVKSKSRVIRPQLKRVPKRMRKLAAHGRKNHRVPEAVTGASARAITLSAELNDPPRLDRSNLHPYRLKVKQLCYVLQLAQESRNQRFVGQLGAVKDAIGEWHDWEVLTGIAQDLLGHGPSCGALRQLRHISNAKFERALSLANGLRSEYTQARGKQSGSTNIPPGALTAIAALGAA